MLNLFYAFSMMLTCFELFFITIKTSQVNKSLTFIPVSIFQRAINTVHEVEEDQIYLYFDNDLLYESLTSYFDKEVVPYTKDFSYDYSYFNPIDGSYCLTDKCTAVRIEVKADIVFNITLEREFEYFLKDNRNG